MSQKDMDEDIISTCYLFDNSKNEQKGISERKEENRIDGFNMQCKHGTHSAISIETKPETR